MNSITILASLVISLLAHEACHAIALRIIGAPIQNFQFGTPVLYRQGIFSLGLLPFWGSVQADLTNLSPIKQAWFFTAGPASSIMMGCVATLIGSWLNIYLLKLLGIVSMAFGAFNLLPIPPMDGYKLVTLGRQVPCPLQVAWAILGWTLIAAASFLWAH